MAAEFGDDNASASDSSLSSSRLSCIDRTERNSRALSLHNSITKSEYDCEIDKESIYPSIYLSIHLSIHLSVYTVH